MTSKTTIGLDIGTTKLVAAIYRRGRIDTLTTPGGNRSKNFILTFTDQNRFFDAAAIYQFVQNPENTIRGSGKSLIGTF